MKKPCHIDHNKIICKLISFMTAALRFDGELNVDMIEFQTNLVPFPRLHFITTFLAPIKSEKKATLSKSLRPLVPFFCFTSSDVLPSVVRYLTPIIRCPRSCILYQYVFECIVTSIEKCLTRKRPSIGVILDRKSDSFKQLTAYLL